MLITFNFFFYILFYLNSLDEKIIFYLLFISFINDTIAYIIGKTFRGPLIVPSLSPNKTWSGTLSSFIVSYFILFIYDFNFIECIFISSSFFLEICSFLLLKEIIS